MWIVMIRLRVSENDLITPSPIAGRVFLLSVTSKLEGCELVSPNFGRRDLAVLRDAPNTPKHLLRAYAGKALAVCGKRPGSRVARVDLESGIGPATGFLRIEQDL